jgi:hypothetical protein
MFLIWTHSADSTHQKQNTSAIFQLLQETNYTRAGSMKLCVLVDQVRYGHAFYTRLKIVT